MNLYLSTNGFALPENKVVTFLLISLGFMVNLIFLSKNSDSKFS